MMRIQTLVMSSVLLAAAAEPKFRFYRLFWWITHEQTLRCAWERVRANGKMRPLGIPTVKDRVVQCAVKIIIEPIFETDFHDCSFGYPSKAFHAVNGYTLHAPQKLCFGGDLAEGHPKGAQAGARMARFLNRKSQRRYRLKFADTYYGELNHYGMYWLKWADVRRCRY